MGKIVYIIPGFGEKTDLERYQKVMQLFKLRGFTTIPITISWKHHRMSDYIVQFLSQVTCDTTDEIYVFGFSLGAMIACISYPEIKPRLQFLCSLSPCFKEDLEHFKKGWEKDMGKRRFEDLKNFSFDTIATKIHCKTILLAGTKECERYPQLERRVREAHTKIKNSDLFFIENAQHDLSQLSYLTKIGEIISTL